MARKWLAEHSRSRLQSVRPVWAKADWLPWPPTLAEQSGHPVLALIGSPFHTDAGLYPIRDSARAAMRDRADNRAGRAVEVAGRTGAGTGARAGICGPAVGAGVGHFRRTWLRTRSEPRAPSSTSRSRSHPAGICLPVVGRRASSGVGRRSAMVRSVNARRRRVAASRKHRPATCRAHRTRDRLTAKHRRAQDFSTLAVDLGRNRRADHRARPEVVRDKRAEVLSRCDGVPLYSKR